MRLHDRALGACRWRSALFSCPVGLDISSLVVVEPEWISQLGVYQLGMQHGSHLRSWHANLTSVHSPAYRYFVERLREARKRAGLTQVDAAKALGRRQTYISKCESGERRVDIVELGEFASLYRRPLSFFLPRSNRRDR
jgi:DNA-binding XRE family transcriptional regulator